MATAELHFFDADDPNGSTIFECSTDDEFVKSIKLNVQRDSLGGGTVTFARKVGVGLFTRNIVVPEVLVRVLIPSIHTTKYFHGFFINPRQQRVVSKAEQGGEGFTFGGPGPKHYLERAILWWTSYTGIGGNVYPEMGVWVWPETAKTGAILNRLLEEDAANPYGPFLPDLTNSFDGTDDSDGVPWDEDIATGDDDLRLKIQENYLKILWMLEDMSGSTSVIDLGTVSNPRLQLEVYQTYGRDLQGPIGAGTVHFTEGVNIAADLDVEGSSYAKASHALVKGNDGVYRVAVKATWDPGELKKAVGTAFDSSNINALELAGTRFLRRQDNGENQIELRVVPGFDDVNGLYMPGWDGSNGYFMPGDTVDLTTGMGSPTVLDYTSEPQAVTGLELELTEAVRDDTSLQAARSWELTVFLNEERKSSNSPVDLAGNRGTISAPAPVIRLCKPAAFAGGVESDFIAALGEACSNDSVGHASDYPPWSGEDEEYVEITSAANVPAGGTILVGVSCNRDGVNFSRDNVVYDEKGNTYTLDAEGTPSGTNDHVPQVWRSVLDTAITTSDYIRFAWRGNTNSGGRCIAAAAWDGPLGSPDVGTLASGFNATPTVADSPVAGITFLTMAAADDDPITGDGDWTDLDPYVEISGTGFNSSGVLTQYLQPGGGDAWTGAIDQSRNWSVVSVGYESGGAGDTQANDGNPDLVGSSPRVARCDHRHDVHRDTAPTVDDDWETQGYKLGTIWAQLDDLDNPTEIIAVWMLLDDSTGAAVWGEWPGGGGSTIDVEEEGTPEGTVDTLNFTGDVDVSVAGSVATIDITGGSGSGVPSGTSFPGGPATDDLFYRTDLDLLFFYNGTLWLTVNEYQTDIFHHGGNGLTADANLIGFPIIADGDTYLTRFFGSTWVSATAIWNVNLIPLTTALAAGTTIATLTTSGDAANTVVRKSATINALVANTTFMMQVVFDETSGSATFIGAVSLRYRRRAT